MFLAAGSSADATHKVVTRIEEGLHLSGVLQGVLGLTWGPGFDRTCWGMGTSRGPV